MGKMNGWMGTCLVSGLLLAACGGTDSATGGSGGGSVSEADIVGKWNITSVHSKGWELDSAGNKKNVDSVETFPAGLNVIEYKSDKSYSNSLGGFGLSGTWSLKGDSITTITSLFGLSDTTRALASVTGKEGTFTSHLVDPTEDQVVTTKATKQ